MRTTKPISTISYNSPEFLTLKLRELTRSGRLTFWAFISHKPEDDETGGKKHIHLYIEPSKMLQTEDLRSELQEFDPLKPDKPKGCISFQSSKFDPWYLYILHDKRYLAQKGQSRVYQYEHGEIVTSDDDELLVKSKSIDLLSLSPYSDMLDAQLQGITWREYFSRGTVPLPQLKLFEAAWYLLLEDRTERNGRSGHEVIDRETGELFSDPE